MAATTVHLVRHGEVENPEHVVYADLPGFGLSERGHRQAADAAEHLATAPISAVYTSPLQRATQTGTAIAAQHKLTIETVPNLTEWLMAQVWKGIVWEDLPELRPGELETYLETPLDMPFSPESLEALALRMVRAIEELASQHVGQQIVVVSHQDPIQAARLALLHRSLGTLNQDKPGHAEIFSLEVGQPWTEVGRYLPAEQESFPPS